MFLYIIYEEQYAYYIVLECYKLIWMNGLLNILFESLIGIFWSAKTVFWWSHWTNDKAIHWKVAYKMDFTVVYYGHVFYVYLRGDTVVKKCPPFKMVALIFWDFYF